MVTSFRNDLQKYIPKRNNAQTLADVFYIETKFIENEVEHTHESLALFSSYERAECELERMKNYFKDKAYVSFEIKSKYVEIDF